MNGRARPARVLPLDNRPRPSNVIALDMGISRGRWEGDTLVVEATNFKKRSVSRNANPETPKVTERFRGSRPARFRWAVTIEDPSTWTRPPIRPDAARSPNRVTGGQSRR